MKWGVRKDDQSAFHTNYAYTDDQGGVIKKKDIINRLKNEINFYNKNLNEITDKKAKKYLQQLTVEERNKRKKEAEAEMNSFLKSFGTVDDDTDIMVDVNPLTGQSKLYIKKSDNISHGGPGSGRWPKGFKMAKEASTATEKTTKAIKNAIPSQYVYQISSHPSYDNLSDEYMRKVVSRNNLETDYAKAVGELKQKPSKGKIAMEALEIIGAIAAIGASASLMLINMNNIKNGKPIQKDKKDD